MADPALNSLLALRCAPGLARELGGWVGRQHDSSRLLQRAPVPGSESESFLLCSLSLAGLCEFLSRAMECDERNITLLRIGDIEVPRPDRQALEAMKKAAEIRLITECGTIRLGDP